MASKIFALSKAFLFTLIGVGLATERQGGRLDSSTSFDEMDDMDSFGLASLLPALNCSSKI